MVVQAYGASAEAAGELGGERPSAPAQGLMPDDHPLGGVHPAADGGADAEQRAPLRPRVQEGAEFTGHGSGQPVRRDAVMGVRAMGQDLSTQVDEGEGRAGDPEVDTSGDRPSGGTDVQIHGNLGTSDSPAPGQFGQLAQQAEPGEVGGLARDRGGAQTGEPGDGAAGHRSVVEDRAQDGGGIGLAPSVARHPRSTGKVPRHGCLSGHCCGGVNSREGPHARRRSAAAVGSAPRGTAGHRRSRVVRRGAPGWAAGARQAPIEPSVTVVRGVGRCLTRGGGRCESPGHVRDLLLSRRSRRLRRFRRLILATLSWDRFAAPAPVHPASPDEAFPPRHGRALPFPPSPDSRDRALALALDPD